MSRLKGFLLSNGSVIFVEEKGSVAYGSEGNSHSYPFSGYIASDLTFKDFIKAENIILRRQDVSVQFETEIEIK